jgi:hypothetical protein
MEIASAVRAERPFKRIDEVTLAEAVIEHIQRSGADCYFSVPEVDAYLVDFGKYAKIDISHVRPERIRALLKSKAFKAKHGVGFSEPRLIIDSKFKSVRNRIHLYRMFKAKKDAATRRIPFDPDELKPPSRAVLFYVPFKTFEDELATKTYENVSQVVVDAALKAAANATPSDLRRSDTTTPRKIRSRSEAVEASDRRADDEMAEAA